MQEPLAQHSDDSQNLLSPWAQFMNVWYQKPSETDGGESLDMGVETPRQGHTSLSSSAPESASSSALHSPRESMTSVLPSGTRSIEEQRWEDYQLGCRQGPNESDEPPPPLFIASELSIAPEFLLPPLNRNGSFRKTLVLDLDQTLIDCALVSITPNSQPSHFVYKDSSGGRAQVWCRPGLQEFLEAVSKVFEVVLFTAAGQRHADAVLGFIDPSRTLFHHRLYQQHTSPDPDWPWVKDLRRLGRDLGSTVIIDDCEKAATATPGNWVGIKPFSQTTAFWSNDKALNEILNFLTEKVLPASDVRLAIASHYNNLLRKPRMLSSPLKDQDSSICKQSLMRVQRVLNNVYRQYLPASNSNLIGQDGEEKPAVNVLEC